MPGNLPAEFLDASWLAAHPVERTSDPVGPAHDFAAPQGGTPIEPAPSSAPEVDERLREELRALGHIRDDSESERD